MTAKEMLITALGKPDSEFTSETIGEDVVFRILQWQDITVTLRRDGLFDVSLAALSEVKLAGILAILKGGTVGIASDG